MIHIFIGTKAQLIKMAPIMALLQQKGIDYNFIFSGQHQSTIKDIREEFGIKNPDITLYNGPDITGIVQMLWWSLKLVLYTVKNRRTVWGSSDKGIVLNHGDTFSTLLGTLLARLAGLQSAHIESGLRSFNVFNPFPEELTRRLVFLLSTHYFAPGSWALKNLDAYRGVKVDTGQNTLIDSLAMSAAQIENAVVDVPNHKFGIVSIHRFENIFFRKKLRRIVEIVEAIATNYSLLVILHKPTEKKLRAFNLYDRLSQHPRIELRPRYSYFQFVKLLRHSQFVVTDGGSNQEECYYLGKPCLVLRKASERQEGIGQNAVLSQYQSERISDFMSSLNELSREEVPVNESPSEQIVRDIQRILNDPSSKQ